MSLLTLALSKGRILEESGPLLARAGIAPTGDPERLLRIPSADPSVSLLIIRPTDVPAYVAYGAADLGIVGKDVLIEHGGEGLYEPLDLGIARCRLSVAGLPPQEGDQRHRRLRVATKYSNIAHQHFLSRGEQVEVIKLYGSMELAPLVGLADVIVDLVASGNTLRANGLVELEVIREISARVVVNTASNKLKHEALTRLLARLRSACAVPA